jgi:hypothetical protein
MNSSSHRRSVLGAFLTCAVLVTFSQTAPAAPPAESGTIPISSACADSYKNAQVKRTSGALRSAREALLVCVSDRCPSVLRPDCMRWLTEVEAAMPSLAFAAKGEGGQDITDVRVAIDGQPLTEVLDGKAVNVDPGTHTVRFEHTGVTAIEQPIVVREGEKARVISVSWAKESAREPSSTHRELEAKSGPPTSAWIFGGLGVVGLGAFGALALHGMQRRSDLRSQCFGSCDQSQVDPIKTEFAIADVALGIGIVSLGVATVLFFTGGSAPSEKSVQVGVAPQKNGGSVGFSGRF